MTERAAYGSDVKYQREAMERPFMGASIQAGRIAVNVWPWNDWSLMTFSGWILEETL